MLKKRVEKKIFYWLKKIYKKTVAQIQKVLIKSAFDKWKNHFDCIWIWTMMDFISLFLFV